MKPRKGIIIEAPLITVKTINRKILDQILPSRLRGLAASGYRDLRDDKDGYWKALGKLPGDHDVILQHTATREVRVCFLRPYCRSKQDIADPALFEQFMEATALSLPTIYVS
jgi:hypothetical protein